MSIYDLTKLITEADIDAAKDALEKFGRKKTDLEIAEEFFAMLSRRGFPVSREVEHPNDPCVTFNIHGDPGEYPNGDPHTCMIFDFIHGDFHRISGYTGGFWSDEIDGKKYY